MTTPSSEDESSAAGRRLYQLWITHSSSVTRDGEKLRDFVYIFLQTYAEFVDVDYARLSVHRLIEDGPHFGTVPSELLQVLHSQLKSCADQLSLMWDSSTLSYAERMISVLIVLSRDFGTLQLVSSTEYVSSILSIAGLVVKQLSSEIFGNINPLRSYLQHAFCYLECLYDPYCSWRISLQGSRMEVDPHKYKAVVLHLEVVPFFYECFERPVLDIESQMRLFHLFGAVISGSQVNALKAISPATVDVLLKVIQSTYLPRRSESAQGVLSLKELVMQCIVSVVHIISRAVPEERQVELSAVIEGYFQILLKQCEDEIDIPLQRALLDKLAGMLHCENRSLLTEIFLSTVICQNLIAFLHCISMNKCDKLTLAISVINVLSDLLSESPLCKDKFEEIIGFRQLLDVLKSLGQPTLPLLEALLDWTVESRYNSEVNQLMKNAHAAVLLIRWMPDISSPELQKWSSASVLRLCTGSSWNSLQCCQAGMNAALLECLQQERRFDVSVVGNLLSLLELTGSVSISPIDLKTVLQMLKVNAPATRPRYSCRLMYALARMARPSTKEIPTSYFDLTFKDSGIVAEGNLGHWSGSGFTFHAWLCIGNEPGDHLAEHRHHPLYSILTTSGSGFEAMLNADRVLVVTVIIKKERLTASVTDCHIADGHWHCIDVVHTTSKRPFGQSQLCVYVDEILKLTMVLKFPSLSDEISVCRLGCGVAHDGKDVKSSVSLSKSVRGEDTKTKTQSVLAAESKSRSIWSRVSFRKSTPDVSVDPASESGGSSFGETVVPLFGQLSEVAIFMEPLLDLHVQSLHRLGCNRQMIQTDDAAVPAELPQKPLLMYHALASNNGVCVDLSGNGNTGLVTGRYCSTLNVKDAINSIGGLTALFLLLEQAVDRRINNVDLLSLDIDLLSASLSDDLSQLMASVENADRDIVRSPLASFFFLLTAMIQNSRANQDALMHDDALAIIGFLLQKADSGTLDMSVHTAIRKFVIAVDSSAKSQVYQHILFDFSIWRKAQFEVCKGHIQYLHTIVKDDRKYFRKKYGVQFLLDMLHKFYGSKSMSGSSAQIIRGALVDLIKFYVGREITMDELSQIVGFICAVHDEVLVCELLDLLISLMEPPGKKDQIYLLMFEPGMAELLYVLLTKREYSAELKEKILKIITMLLRTNHVYERSKARLRLLDSNLYPGLVSLMADTLPSVYMIRHMLEQVFISESGASVNASLYIIQSLCLCDVRVKLEAVRQLMKILLSKPTIPKLFARQLGWQRALVSLFICHPNAVGSGKRHSVDVSSITSVEPSRTLPTDKPLRTLNRQRSNSSGAANEIDYDCIYEIDDDFTMASSPPKCSPSEMFNDPYSSRRRQSSGEDFDALVGGRGIMKPRSASCTSNLSQSLSESGSVSPLSSSTTSNDWVQLRYEDCDDRMTATLRTMGLTLPSPTTTDGAGDRLENTEELCQNLLIVLFTIMWRGIESTPTDDTTWQERGQVFAALMYTGRENELLMSKTELTRKLLELLLQGSIMELRDSARSNVNSIKNASQLIKQIYYFLCLDDGLDTEKYSVRLMEDVLALFELLSLWQAGCDLKELEQMALRILLSCAAQDSIDLCSSAAARLHTLVQTRPVEKLQESCYIVGSVGGVLAQSFGEREERFNFVIPVMKALLERCEDMLNISALLPSMPLTRNNPSFCEDFREYLRSSEWVSFMKKQVIPSKEQYEANIYESLHVQMTSFMGTCSERMMENINKRDCEKAEGKRKFEEEIMTAFNNRLEQEKLRFRNVLLQMRNQSSSAQRNWTLMKTFLTGERGIWIDKNLPLTVHLKLSTQENRMRMRPKLIPNNMFDQHADASRLRDNEDVEEDTTSEILTLVKEAHVVSLELGDDRLGDDEWNLLSSNQASPALNNDELAGNEKLVLKEDCELVTIMEEIKGRLEVTTSAVYFIDYTTQREGTTQTYDFKWQLSELREIHFRRYNLRRSALEFFLVDQTSYFFNFQKEVRNKVYTRIVSLHPPNLIYYQSRSPAELLKSSGLTQKWVQREISNFEYLMHLNTIAGRTYNDLSQYPVFPWILSNYTSDNLDLTDPSNYRDLSRPIGVVNPKNEEEVREKFENFEDPSGTIPKFHYGTHYSNPPGVMHYLIRLEPFTSLHIQLQGGRFDVADRQFHSIPAMWQGLTETPNDVKELIPEFFYLPEFLENSNDFDLGRLQHCGDRVDHVILPPWANSPHDFIQKHMKALESDHVSSHLHEWIDLIFGYKQQGQAAIEALNVFYYCTYEGAVDLDSITDESKSKALEGMIKNFGQTPCQLLKEPHPRRMTYDELTSSKQLRVDRPLPVYHQPTQLKTFVVEAAALPKDPLAFVCIPRSQIRSFMQHNTLDTMVVVTQEGVVGTHSWLPYDKAITNFFTFERDPLMNSVKTRRRLLPVGGSWSPRIKVGPRLFDVSPDAKLLYFGGSWDNSVRVYNIKSGKQTAYAVRHTDVVTCVSLDYCGRRLISGSRDHTCIIWDVTQPNGINPKPLHVLHGHDSHITCVAIATELDIAVSGAKDGVILVHTVRHGTYVRTLRPPYEKGWQITVEQLVMSDMGQLCVYCRHTLKSNNSSPGKGSSSSAEKYTLHLYSVNGKHMSRESVTAPISDMVISGNYLFYGDVYGMLVIKELYGFHSSTSLPLNSAVSCITVTNTAGHILIGLQDCNLSVVAVRKPNELRP